MKKKHAPAPAVAKAQLEALRRLARSGKLNDTFVRIHAEPSPPTLPPESYARFCKTFELMAQGKLRGAMVILRDLIAEHPDDAGLYNNLAGIKEGLRHPDKEIAALLEKSLSLKPGYLFAIAGLARIAARRGEITCAQALLAPLLQHTSYHFTAWRTILMTQLAIAQQSGEIGVAIGLQQQLAELQQQFS